MDGTIHNLITAPDHWLCSNFAFRHALHLIIFTVCVSAHALAHLLFACYVVCYTSLASRYCWVHKHLCTSIIQARWMQEYIREIGAALIQMEQTQDQTAQAMMETLTVESSRLLGCVKLLNHDVHKAMLAGKLDPSLANTHRLGVGFYTNLTVSFCCLVSCMQPSAALTDACIARTSHIGVVLPG